MGILSRQINSFDGVRDSVELSRILLNEREKLSSELTSLSGIGMMNAFSDLTDALIIRIFECAIEDAGKTAECNCSTMIPQNLAVAAVGGYGRREMSPFSDVDVAFIVDNDENDEADLVVKRAFRILMDVLDNAGLKVGYSYRKADEVDDLPIETQTALLDARCVAGSRLVFNEFCNELHKAIVPAKFVIEHINGRKNANNSLNTPYAIEPNIKECRGGLRDLHATRWISQIAFGFSADDIWTGLRSRGILLDNEVAEIEEATEFITKTRNILHLLAGHGLDTLSIERQYDVADKMGLASEDEIAFRDFIKCYYRHAHSIWRIFTKVASACLEQDLEIEPGVVARDGKLHILDRGLLARDNSAVIRVFKDARSLGLQISYSAGDVIANTARGLHLAQETGRSFLDILSSPGAGAALRAMSEIDILKFVIPQFNELMCLVPGDAAHQFTVGEHSLRSVENLDAMFFEHDERLRDVCSSIEHYEILYLATLLHDIGKLDSKRDHAKTGASKAAKIAKSLGMSEEACASVEFLVRNHLKMSETARLRDLQQKRTIKEFTSTVKDTKLLDMLLLLTVADSRAVGGLTWSQIQIRFLLELHERAYAALRSPSSDGPDIDRHRKRVKRELCLANLPVDEVDEHCASMPASYLLNTPPDELAAHIGYVRNVREGSPVIEMKDDRVGRFTRLTVVSHDRPALLSSIAGVLHAIGADIHAAQIFTRHTFDDIVIDILHIDFEGHQLSEMRKWQVEGELGGVLRGEVEIADLMKRWGKDKFKKPDEFGYKVMDNLADHSTVLEIRADDTSGLLYFLTRKISELGWNIHSARVATWGHEARDVFYVTDKNRELLNGVEIKRLGDILGAKELI